MALDPATKENSKGTMGRACAFNQQGNEIAIGFRDGSFRIYSLNYAKGIQCKLKYTKPLSKEWIEDLKYSPDGNYLAVASHDNKTYIMDCNKGKFVKKFGKGSSFISSIDWN